VQTFDNEDYNTFLSDFTVRVNGAAYRACPAHYVSGAPDDTGCKNFRKPNVSSASPVRRVLHPALTKLWARAATVTSGTARGGSGGGVSGGRGTAGGSGGDAACVFVAELQMDQEAHVNAGAPVGRNKPLRFSVRLYRYSILDNLTV